MVPPTHYDTRYDTRNELSTSRNRSKHSFRLVERDGRSSSTASNPTDTAAAHPTFGEDFMLEHSRLGVQIVLAKMSGRSTKASQESPQMYGFPC
jgi:hypothetical protein